MEHLLNMLSYTVYLQLLVFQHDAILIPVSRQTGKSVFSLHIWAHEANENSVYKIIELKPPMRLEPDSWKDFSSILTTKSCWFSRKQASKWGCSSSPLGNFNKLGIKQTTNWLFPSRWRCSSAGKQGGLQHAKLTNVPSWQLHQAGETDNSHSTTSLEQESQSLQFL